MIVYHGSYEEIKVIDLSKSKFGRDFGRGFYVTTVLEQAKKWATQKGREVGTLGIVSDFEFDESAFLNNEYKTYRFNGYTDEWFEFVVANRNNKSDALIHDYDIVEGPLADDDVSKRVKNYLNGKISKKEFFKDLQFKDYTNQICFCTAPSLETISRKNLSHLYKIEHIGNSVVNYLIANDKLLPENAIYLYHQSEIYKKVSDENLSLYLKPWQEIYGILKREMGKTQTKQKDDDGLSLS